MRIAMAQMSMQADKNANAKKSLAFCDEAGAAGADLLFYPEVQLTRFFAQHHADHYSPREVDSFATRPDDPFLAKVADAAREHDMWVSPNVYLEEEDGRYDASLVFDHAGRPRETSTMVHVAQAPQFFEQDYYTPSKSGFVVHDAPWGRLGIVICFDRHLPESIRTCAAMGAQLVIVPTANCKAEPMDLFEWEVRAQAMQNGVFVAMCNRVGREDQMDFAGESLVAAPDGSLVAKADDTEQLVLVDVDLADSTRRQEALPYLRLRRPDMYR